jgi:aromatic-amino-acid transaminase
MPQKNDAILLLNQEAQELKKQGVDVTNGAIGMMYLDDGKLPVSQEIRAVLSRHTEDQDLTYSSVIGTKDYLQALRHWFLGNSFEEEAQKGEFLSLATPGGTGAVCLSFALSRGTKNAVLLPSLGWPNYTGIAKGFGLEAAFYNLFKDGALDLAGISQALQTLFSNHDHVSLLINDPCQNPTGYCLSHEEWKAVVDLLSNPSYRGKVDLIIDAAYIDFATPSQREGLLMAIKRLPEDVLCYFCFSFSKTLSFYGLRIGALSLYGKNAARLAASIDAATMEARALWSVPNHMAMNAVSELLNDEKKNALLRKEVEENRNIVAKRASIFFEEVKAEGLDLYPYKSGFFVTVKLPDAYQTSLELKGRRIFLAPLSDHALRVALCSLPTVKVPGLAKAIKECAHD